MTQSTDARLRDLVALSRRYGADPSIVLAGGGNSSVKTAERLFVKGSGHALATIAEDGFVEMDRGALDALAQADLGPDPVQREAAFKDAIHAARVHPEKGQRPSVECLLHHLLPERYVFHSHATLANALGCCTAGEGLARELLGDEVLWLPYVDPGFTLARSLQEGLRTYRERTGKSSPPILLMANHGLIVQGEDPEQLARRTEWILERIEARLGAGWRDGAFGPVTRCSDPRSLVALVAPALRGLLARSDEALAVVRFDDSELALSLAGSAQAEAIAMGGPLTPDQIVYCDSFPMVVALEENMEEGALVGELRRAVQEHAARFGAMPRITLVPGLGILAAGDDIESATRARDLYLDAVAVMAGATRLGGIRHLDEAHRRFIEDWEVEAYRRKIAAASRGAGRANGRVAVVTGAAQGFGREIAEALAAEGGHVVLADVNRAGVEEAAAALGAQHGAGRALGLALDVTDAESIAAALHMVLRRYGGLDLLVSNAGVLRAESLKSQPARDFRLVTEVNYVGYFLCAQAAAPILARQHAARPGWMGDIIQINSKSGLAGSNRNSAYAGSKFGGIGLTQSFALELVADGIKVNSICPGNFFDGPLWSDPENGLFVQYLRAGKVPGAKAVEDIRRAYEAKVPMGRGCTSADVMKALFYLVEQRYETGQALPVTGGQVMLR